MSFGRTRILVFDTAKHPLRSWCLMKKIEYRHMNITWFGKELELDFPTK